MPTSNHARAAIAARRGHPPETRQDSQHPAMTDALVDAKFKQLCDALTRHVAALGRDPNAVLEADRRLLKVRLMVTPPPAARWKPFRFHPDHLTGSTDPEEFAADIVAEWQTAASNRDIVGR